MAERARIFNKRFPYLRKTRLKIEKIYNNLNIWKNSTVKIADNPRKYNEEY